MIIGEYPKSWQSVHWSCTWAFYNKCILTHCSTSKNGYFANTHFVILNPGISWMEFLLSSKVRVCRVLTFSQFTLSFWPFLLFSDVKGCSSFSISSTILSTSLSCTGMALVEDGRCAVSLDVVLGFFDLKLRYRFFKRYSTDDWHKKKRDRMHTITLLQIKAFI